MSDGKRKVTSVAEITGMEESVISSKRYSPSRRKELGA